MRINHERNPSIWKHTLEKSFNSQMHRVITRCHYREISPTVETEPPPIPPPALALALARSGVIQFGFN
jgi:hypothetical protein